MSRFQEDLNILNTRDKSNQEIITLINNESPQIREIQQVRSINKMKLNLKINLY